MREALAQGASQSLWGDGERSHVLLKWVCEGEPVESFLGKLLPRVSCRGSSVMGRWWLVGLMIGKKN